ncbi:uncharacterized protein LOC134287418 [Aedes albopictus]|uniref:Helix-turn-helix domain-containing protein n=1 Tax=Aedes albopictus TaxID=7160 RepID=A0ABM1ZGY3_AEDAL
MLNYRSYHQSKHKINVAKNFIHRVWYLTRNKSTREISEIIHRQLQLNDYPKQIINRLLNLYGNKRQPPTLIEITDTQSRPSLHPPTQPAILPAIPTPPPAILPAEPATFHQHPTPPAILPATPIPLPDILPAEPISSRQPPTPHAVMPAKPTSQSQPVAQQLQPNDVNQIQQQPGMSRPQPNRSTIIDHNVHQTSSSAKDHTYSDTVTNPSCTDNPAAETPEITNNVKMYRAIPYVPALSQRITKILAKDYPNIAIATKQNRVIKNLHTHVKHPVNKDDVSNIIYKIPCNDCASCYIGMTSNTLRRRLTGHRANINKLEKLKNDNNTNTEIAKASLIETTTALIQHCIEQDHRFDLEHTQIVDHSYKKSTLPFLEMCHITNTDHTVNKRTDIDKLSTTYAAVLHDIKSNNERKTTRRDNNIHERDSISPIGHVDHP